MVFCIFVPNVIKVDPYNFERYRFKVGEFFATRFILLMQRSWMVSVLQSSSVFVYSFGKQRRRSSVQTM